ncbi:hypothetical protein F5884DRAFT_849500 [Xylogone sp. PMI_703]|nr:hypothetical protein F5884DRAFT_849500 [Xylogone sp. PMI_703]
MELFADLHIDSALVTDTSSSGSRKTRSACDRCHYQKLRCVRRQEQSVCDRCLKLNTSCRFSARAPRTSTRSQEQIDANNSGHWYGLRPQPELIATLSNGPNAITDSLGSGDLFLPLSPVTDGNRDGGYSSVESYPIDMPQSIWPAMDQSSPIQQLANISTALQRLSAQFPAIDLTSMSSTSVRERIMAARGTVTLAIDELFNLTSNFINLVDDAPTMNYKTSFTKFSVDRNNLGSQSPSSAIRQQALQSSQAGINAPYEALLHVDEEAKMSLVVSCHYRLTNIYETIFQMMEACVSHSISFSDSKSWSMVLPELKIGSFVCPPLYVDATTQPPMATILLYMDIFALLSSRLWKQLALVARAKGGSSSNSPQASQYWLAERWDAMEDKTNRMSQTIEATRSLLLQESISVG